jgi:arylsulfatase A-like enzyme
VALNLGSRWRVAAAVTLIVAVSLLGYAIAVAARVHPAGHPRTGPTGSPPASTPSPAPYRRSGPSIVLILTDDQRWDTLWAMPTVQRELVARGITFSNAFLVNSLCCPSRATILTGKYSHSTGVYSDVGPHGGFHAFRDRSTIATWLRAYGYHTALFGKYLNQYSGRYIPPGWDRWFSYQYHGAYYDYRVNDQGVIRAFGDRPSDYSTTLLADRAVSFIRNTTGPLFLYVAPFAPHYPATPPPQYRTAFSDLPPYRPPNYDEADVSDKPAYARARHLFTPANEALIDGIRRDQYRSLLGVDDAVKQILDALRATHRLRTALILFMTDNGQTWGEHRFGIFKQVPYEESIRTPFVIRDDQLIHRSRTDPNLVLNLDVAQTFAEVAGVPAPGAEGLSLVPLFTNPDAPWRSDFLIEHTAGSSIPTYCAVRSTRYIYVFYSTGERELYDLTRDPFELQNRADDPRYRSVLSALRVRLRQLCSPPPPGYQPG